MEKSRVLTPNRNILCLFDVDGTLTAPREVSQQPSCPRGAEADWMSMPFVCMSQCRNVASRIIAFKLHNQRKGSVKVGSLSEPREGTMCDCYTTHTNNRNAPGCMFCNVLVSGGDTHWIRLYALVLWQLWLHEKPFKNNHFPIKNVKKNKNKI